MVEDRTYFVFVVIQKELFEQVVMNYLMSKIEQYPNDLIRKNDLNINHNRKTYSG